MATQQTYWFRPKRYGYGAEPANWMGWLATGVYLAVVLMIAWFVMIEPVLGGREVSDTTTFFAWVGLVALTLAFLWLCRVKSDGIWRWRWGRSD